MGWVIYFSTSSRTYAPIPAPSAYRGRPGDVQICGVVESELGHMGRRETSGELLQPKRTLREGGRGPRRPRARATCRTRRTNMTENLRERPVRVGRSHARATRAGGQKEQKQLTLEPRHISPAPASSTATRVTGLAAGRPCGMKGLSTLLCVAVAVRKSGVVVVAEPTIGHGREHHNPDG